VADIVVVGSANVDLVVRTARLPRPGETVLGSDFITSPGGKGANQAVACARLGAQTLFVGRRGNDSFGDLILRTLGRAGVATEALIIDEGAPSGIALIPVDDAGHNMITVAPGANARLTPADVERVWPERGPVVVLMQLEVPLEAVTRAARLGRERGAKVILNPAPARDLPAELLRLVDVLTPNQTELALLSGIAVDTLEDVDRAARALMARGPASIVVTLAAAGSLVVTRAGATHVPGLVVEAVDTTGAGDAFNGALAFSLAEDAALEEAARFANAVGALATTAVGAQEALPTHAQVVAFLAARAKR
jgi:ribokinase